MGKGSKSLVFAALFFALAAVAATGALARKLPQGSQNNGKNKPRVMKASEVAPDDRAVVSNAARAPVPDGSTTTGSTTSTTTTATEEDETNELYYNLRMCVQDKCNGDVPWQNCFKPDNIDSFIRSDSQCKKLYDDASDVKIRINAVGRLKQDMKNYADSACTDVHPDARSQNGVCKVPLYYKATSHTGDKKKSTAKWVSIGQSLTCSYVSFAIDPHELEYQEDWGAQEWAGVIQSGTQLLQGGINITMNAIEMNRAGKKMQQMSAVLGTYVYEFNGTSLSQLAECATATYDKNTGAGEVEKRDAENKKYWLIDKRSTSPYCTGTGIKANPPKCDGLTSTDWGDSSGGKTRYKKCWVKLENMTENDRDKKQQELIRKFGVLDDAKSKATAAQNTKDILSTFGNMALAQEMGNAMTGFGYGTTSTAVEQEWEYCALAGADLCVNGREDTDSSKCKAGGTQTLMVVVGKDCGGADKEFASCNIGSNYCRRRAGDVNMYDCLAGDQGNRTDGSKKTASGCTFREGTFMRPYTPGAADPEEDELNVNKYFSSSAAGVDIGYKKSDGNTGKSDGSTKIGCNIGNIYDIESGKMEEITAANRAECNKARQARYGTAMQDNMTAKTAGVVALANLSATGFGNEQLDEDIKKYNADMSSYKSTQSAINKRETDYKEAEATKSEKLNDMLTTGSSQLLQGGVSMAGVFLAYDEKKGTMTGNCYIGDPDISGIMFATEGQTKKIGWHN